MDNKKVNSLKEYSLTVNDLIALMKTYANEGMGLCHVSIIQPAFPYLGRVNICPIMGGFRNNEDVYLMDLNMMTKKKLMKKLFGDNPMKAINTY